MELRHLKYFVRVAEAGSFSGAAAQLEIAQPTLSRQIADLEHEVGCPLFARHSRGVVVTEAGTAMLEHARGIIAQARHAIADTSTQSRVASGLAALGAPHPIGPIIFGDVAQRYKERFPGVTLRFADGLSYQLLEWLDAGRLDLAIVHNVKPNRNYRAVRLFTEPVFAIGPPGHPLTGSARPSISVKELSQYPLIISSALNHGRKVAMQVAATQGVSLKVNIEAENPETVKAMVERNLGLALLSYSSVAGELEAGVFSGKRVEVLRHERFLVQRREKTSKKAVAELARVVIETIDQKAQSGAFGSAVMGAATRKMAA